MTKTTNMTDDELLAAERVLETEAYEEGRARYRALLEKRGLENSSPGSELMRQTIGDVIAGIAEWQAAAADGTPGRSVGLAKFIAQYDTDEVAFITLLHVVRALHDTKKLVAVAMDVTRDLEVIDLESRLKQADLKLHTRYVRTVARRKDHKRMAILKMNGEYLGVFSAKAGFAWSDSERLQVGVRLLEIVRETTGIYETLIATDLGESGQASQATYYIVASGLRRRTRQWSSPAPCFTQWSSLPATGRTTVGAGTSRAIGGTAARS